MSKAFLGLLTHGQISRIALSSAGQNYGNWAIGDIVTGMKKGYDRLQLNDSKPSLKWT